MIVSVAGLDRLLGGTRIVQLLLPPMEKLLSGFVRRSTLLIVHLALLQVIVPLLQNFGSLFVFCKLLRT